MSQTVDSRIVELKMDVAQFEQKIKATLENLSGLKTSLDKLSGNSGMKNLSAEASKSTKGMNEIADSVEFVSSKFTALGIMGVTALQNITNSAINTGKRLVNALAIKPPKDGLEEYELQINSVQTIMANTGKDVETVNDALDKLNTYADLTIYKFGDMTKNAGMFTAAGVSLEDTMIAMKGIGNWAAFAGASTQDMSRATYQLGQSLATGTIKLRDWMSIENTGGMAGKKYQEAFMETARKHGVAVDQIVKANGSFRESLSEGWLTSDIFIETMQKFAKDQSMTDAATKVKTFTQLIDTLQEALGTGWAQVWRTVIGDFEEAKEMWSAVNDELSGIINNAFTSINDVVNEWNTHLEDCGELGRDVLIAAFEHAWDAIKNIAGSIKNAWFDVFSPITGKDLQDITSKFNLFTYSLKMYTEKNGEKITKVFTGLFTVLKNGLTIVRAISKILVGGMRLAAPLISFIFNMAVGISNLITGVSTLSSKFNVITVIGNTIGQVFTGLGELLTFIGSKIKPIFSDIGNAVKAFSKAFAGVMSDFNNVQAIFNTVGIVVFIDNITKLTSALKAPVKLFEELGGSFKGVFKSMSGVFTGAAESLEKVGEVLTAWQANLRANTILQLAIAVGVLSMAVSTLADLKPNKLLKACFAMEIMAIELSTTMLIIEKSGAINLKNSILGGRVGTMLLQLAASMYILSKAAAILGQMDSKALKRSMIAMTVLLGETIATVKILSSQNPSKMTKGLFAMIEIASAINLLSKSVVTLGKLSFDEIVKGLSGVTALLTVMIAATYAISTNTSGLISAGIAMTIMGGAIAILANSVKTLGALNVKTLEKGLLSIVSLLAAITIVSRAVGNGANLIGIGIAMGVMAVSMKIFASAVNDFGSLDLKTLGKGLLAITIALAELAIVSRVMSSNIAGAVAIGIMSFALASLAPVIKTLGSMPIKNIVTGLVTIAATMGIIAGLAVVFSSATVPLLAFSAGLLVFGVALNTIGSGMILVGSGMISIAAGITSLALSATSNVANIVTSLSLMLNFIIQNIRNIGKAIADGFVAFVTEIAANTPTLVKAVSETISEILDGITINAPKMIKAALTIISSFLTEMGKHTQELVDGGIKMVVGVINGISANLPSMIQAGYDLVIAFIDGLSVAIVENAEPLREAMINLAKSMVEGFKKFMGINSPSTVMMEMGGYIIQGLANGLTNAGQIVAIMASLATKMINAIRSKIAAFRSAGITMASNIISGIGSKASAVGTKAKALATAATNSLKNATKNFKTVGKDAIQGFINGLGSLTSKLLSKAGSLGKQALAALKRSIKSNSPSKKFMEVGGFAVEGFAIGLSKYAKLSNKEAGKVGNSAVDTMTDALSGMSKAVDNDVSTQPTIKPVMDLSNVTAGSQQIDALMSRVQALEVNANVNAKDTQYQQLRDSVVSGVKEAIKSVVDSNDDNNNVTINLNSTLECEGKTLAEVSAKYMDKELNKIVSRVNRQLGIV